MTDKVTRSLVNVLKHLPTKVVRYLPLQLVEKKPKGKGQWVLNLYPPRWSEIQLWMNIYVAVCGNGHIFQNNFISHDMILVHLEVLFLEDPLGSHLSDSGVELMCPVICADCRAGSKADKDHPGTSVLSRCSTSTEAALTWKLTALLFKCSKHSS